MLYVFVTLLLLGLLLFSIARKGIDDSLAWKGKIIAVVEGPGGRRVYETENVITNAGDIFYAQKAAGETPANAFGNLYLGSTATPSPSKTSDFSSITLVENTEKAPSTGYPKTNDSDPDNGNGGANVITWKYYYGKADFTAASITEGVIAAPGATGTDPVLCHFAFPSAFEKTANDTLTVFVNHTCTGS